MSAKIHVAKIGGYEGIGDYFANDFVIGNFIEKAGYKVVLSENIIDHVVPPMTFKKMWERQVRWAKSTRYSQTQRTFWNWTDFFRTLWNFRLHGYGGARVCRRWGCITRRQRS